MHLNDNFLLKCLVDSFGQLYLSSTLLMISLCTWMTFFFWDTLSIVSNTLSSIPWFCTRNNSNHGGEVFRVLIHFYHAWIPDKPISFTGQLETTVYGFQNESRNLTCQVYAYPVAYFIWYRNNIPMDPRKNHIKIYNEENISILEVRGLCTPYYYGTCTDLNSMCQCPKDNETAKFLLYSINFYQFLYCFQVSLMALKVLGNYSCEAANSLGYLIQTINVQLINKPISPKLLVFEYSDVFAMISVVIEPYPTYDFTCHIDCTEYTYCSYEEKWKRGISLECKNDSKLFTLSSLVRVS